MNWRRILALLMTVAAVGWMARGGWRPQRAPDHRTRRAFWADAIRALPRLAR